MSKYIDAEKLIKAIEEKGLDCSFALKMERLDTLALVDSLQQEQEQPDMDLEEYIENEINHYGLSLYEASYGTFSASQIDRIIRNAFELGLNARKEE